MGWKLDVYFEALFVPINETRTKNKWLGIVGRDAARMLLQKQRHVWME